MLLLLLCSPSLQWRDLKESVSAVSLAAPLFLSLSPTVSLSLLCSLTAGSPAKCSAVCGPARPSPITTKQGQTHTSPIPVPLTLNNRGSEFWFVSERVCDSRAQGETEAAHKWFDVRKSLFDLTAFMWDRRPFVA